VELGVLVGALLTAALAGCGASYTYDTNGNVTGVGSLDTCKWAYERVSTEPPTCRSVSDQAFARRDDEGADS
jgi:hypothetical protein